MSEASLSEKLLDYIRDHANDIATDRELERRADRHFEIATHHLKRHGIPTDTLHPLSEYAEFILQQGTYTEQGELVQGLQITLAIKDRNLIQA